MHTYIALFRGINVGGNNLLPMKVLSNILETMGFVHVRTYIQSGNVVFDSKKKHSAKTRTEISKIIEEQVGFHPEVLLLGASELQTAISNNPFDTTVGKTLHFYFLEAVPQQPDLEKLESIKKPTEQFELIGSVFYLFAPEGIGRSKLAASIERHMNTPATARNWNTVNKLHEMIEA